MRKLRHIPHVGALVEITNKTVQDRYLFRPSAQLNRRIAGVLAKAQEITGMRIHGAVFLSNHYHLLISPETVEQMALFMSHVGTNLSKEVKKLHNWTGPLFARRYHAIPVSDEEPAQVARLTYLLSQGTKEGLVMAPAEWPGFHTIEALTRGEPIRGIWIDRTKMWAARNSGENPNHSDHRREIELKLSPLPCWAHIDAKVYRRRVRKILDRIERETLDRHQRDGTVPAGTTQVLRQHPHHRPSPTEGSLQPLFHAFERSIRCALERKYGEFVGAYRKAAEKLVETPVKVGFPENCFPPRLPFVKPIDLLEPG